MNVVVYMVAGWLFGELIHLTLWEWLKKKFRIEDKRLKRTLLFIGIALVIAVVASGFYRVSSGENVILTTLSGSKVVKDSPGLKYSLLSGRESVNVQKQLMKYPETLTFDGGFEMVTADDKPVIVSSFLEYRVVDVYKWGVENKDSKDKLRVLLGSKVKNTIQKSSYETIREDLKLLEVGLFSELNAFEEGYGFEIISVSLQVVDNPSVQVAKSNAEKARIDSEVLKESYFNEAEALKTKYSSLEDKEFIKFMEFLKAVKEGGVDLIMSSDLGASLKLEVDDGRTT